MVTRVIAACVVVVAAVGACRRSPAESPNVRVDALFAEWNRPDSPGCSLAVSRASRTLRQVGWFEVVQTRGHVEEGKVAHYQVILKVGFTLEDC